MSTTLPQFPADWIGVVNAKNVALSSFRQDGRAVTTPMWVAVDGARILTTADHDAWKLKRIANNPSIRLAPCTVRGRVTGPAVDAVARILDARGTESAIAAKKRRYVSFRLMARFRKPQVGIEIVPARSGA
jgi:hypothetical protein